MRGRVCLAALAFVALASGVVWPPGTAEAQSAEPPPVGPVDTPSNSEGSAICNVGIRPDFWDNDGSPVFERANSSVVVVARCHVKPFTLADPGFRAQWGVQDMSNNAMTSFLLDSSANNPERTDCLPFELDGPRGRVGFSCTGSQLPAGSGQFRGIVEGGRGYGVTYAGIGVTQAHRRSTAGFIAARDDGVRWDNQVIYTDAPQLVPWPAWWPQGADPVAEEPGYGVAMPRLTCRQATRVDADGVTRATFRVTVRNPVAGAVDHVPQWKFEWETDDGIQALPGRTYRDAAWAETFGHLGAVQYDVDIPTADLPESGYWIARAEVRRTFAESQRFDLPLSYMHEPEFEGDGSFQWMMDKTLGRVGLGGIVIPEDLANSGPAAEAWSSNNAYRVTESMEVEGIRYWDDVTASCGLRVTPGRDGTETIYTSPDTSEGLPAPAAGPVDENGEPVGDSCGGLGWNPLTWVESVACGVGDVFGGLLGGLAGLADALAGLLDVLWAVVEWLWDQLWALFDPAGTDTSWDDEKAIAEGKAPFVHLAAVSTAVGDLQAMTTAGGGGPGPGGSGCVMVGIDSTSGECLAVPSNFPGASFVKMLFAATIWIGVATRIIRTAPWAKGKDGGEPG